MTISQMVLIAYLCICLALYCQHLYESFIAYRQRRELENEFLLRVGMNDLCGDDYKTRVAKFYDDCA